MTQKSSSTKIDIKKLSLILIVVSLILLGLIFREKLNKENLEIFLDSLGIWAPVVFIAIYSIAPVIFFPGVILTLLGGFIFGPLWGTAYVLIGATIGATLALLVARYLASDWAEKNAKGLLAKVKKGVEEEGWRFVAITRLIPLFPFTVLNYAFGLTKISVLTYAVTSMITMLPGVFAYVYIGYVGKEAASGSKDLFIKISIALALLILISFIPKFFKKKS